MGASEVTSEGKGWGEETLGDFDGGGGGGLPRLPL